jgi:REP element-mobilizing transposase RayT
MKFPCSADEASLPCEMKEFYRRQLPHIHPHHATYFITFRLIHSIPVKIIEQLQSEYHDYEQQLKRQPEMTEPEKRRIALEEYHHAYFLAFDEFLDGQREGNRWLANEALADMVREALHHRDGRVYDLLCYTIMPNHVHLICTIDAAVISERRTGHGSRITAVATILHSLKRYTAREGNILLGREGALWQSESYDRIVRNEQELERTIRYVLNNPVKAGFVKDPSEWRYSYCKYM